MRHVLVCGLKKVDQMFVLTTAGYNLTRLRSLGKTACRGRRAGKMGRKPCFAEEKNAGSQIFHYMEKVFQTAERVRAQGVFQRPAMKATKYQASPVI